MAVSLVIKGGETDNQLRIGLSNVDWFFMQCWVIIYCNSPLCFILTRQQETIKEPMVKPIPCFRRKLLCKAFYIFVKFLYYLALTVHCLIGLLKLVNKKTTKHKKIIILKNITTQ
jgi:hypothetical protein